MGFWSKLINGLKRSNESFNSKFFALFSKKEINEDFYEELESILISSDISISTTTQIIKSLRVVVKQKKLRSCDEVKRALKDILIEILSKTESSEIKYPIIYLIIGVNGVGKTTSIGKLANYFSSKGKKVLLVSGDTFRAAANEQLSQWAKRSKTRIVQSIEGSDAASVVFDGIKSARAKGDDVVIVDTAGRLQSKVNLMEELKKVSRIIEREKNEFNYRKLIVLDATTGQNALSQVNYFDEAVNIDGIILTKLDGTAKGGVIVSILNEKNIPIDFIGMGETVDDLIEFDVKQYVENLF